MFFYLIYDLFIVQKEGVLFDKSYIQYEPRALIKSKDYIHLACGKEYTLAVTNKGELHGWGKGFIGKNKSLQPEVIPMPKKIKYVAAGKTHSAAIDEDGQVYTWGTNGDWYNGGGQLGHNNTNTVDTPK